MMLRYHGRILIRAIVLLWRGWDLALSVPLAIGVVVVLFNREVGESISDGWTGISPWYAVIGVGLLLVVGLMQANYENVKKQKGRIDELEVKIDVLDKAPKPHLMIIGVSIDTDARMGSYFETDQGTHFVPSDAPMSWARVLVTNDPGEKIGACAEKVVAHVIFKDGNGREFVVDGRWAEAPQAPEITRLGLSKEGRELDIEANGDGHPLDIAMKFQDEEVCYAYNNDNGREAGSTNGRLQRHLLEGRRIEVTVTLRGGNTLPVHDEFILTHRGAGSHLGLDEPDARDGDARVGEEPIESDA